MGERRKILFVVYRTEWWGCFDSYCRQACAEEDTLCYVMPVPRYERNELTLKVDFDRVHFRPEKLAPLLPEGAQMADYREFSLEQGFERIYIHNPYENGSPLDTVEVKYYAANLKQYAEKLIYVPHLLSLPVTNYANCKAFEYVDAIYVSNMDPKYALDVKYDSKVEVVPSGIPDYLDRLSAKMDGQGNIANGQGNTVKGQGNARNGKNHIENGQQTPAKKKLLYCVSFDDLYCGSEKQLAKMRDVFEYARGNQDILLIFRPDEDIPVLRLQHHLDDSIWTEYEELVAWFVKKRIGIYDGTPDLYEMAVLADGILCTGHPMTSLFRIEGKYVLQLDWTRRPIPNREDRCIPALCAITAEEMGEEIELWFVPERTKLICRMRISGNAAPGNSGSNRSAGAGRAGGRKKAHKHLSGPKVEIVAEVPDEMIGGLNYINVTKVGHCLYLSPHASDGIWKYDLNTGTFSKQYLQGAVHANTGVTFSYGKYLYMIPRLYRGIVKYDTETGEAAVIDGWVEALEQYVDEACKVEPYFVWAVNQEGSVLYMASSKSDVWMEFDMSNDTWTLRSMGLSGKKFAHMVKDGEWVWLLPFCGDEIVLWNCRTGEGQAVYETVNVEARNAPYGFFVDRGDAVICFPQQKTDHFLVIEKPYLSGKMGAERTAETDRTAEANRIAETNSIARTNRTAEANRIARTNRMAETDRTVEMDRAAETVWMVEANMGDDAVDAGAWIKNIKAREVRNGLPCGVEANLTEYQKQRNMGYQYVKRLDSGLILAYEYYDGSFLLLNENLQAVKKISCRLPIEAVRQQQDTIWMNGQCSGRFHGAISECYSIPAMMEYFVRHGDMDRERIRERYRRYYR